MTHFSVTVRVTQERLDRHKGDLDAAIAEMFAPFDENTKNPEYLAFNDETDDCRRKYEEESRDYIRIKSGSLICRYDRDYWDVHGVRDTDSFGSKKAPPGAIIQKVPFKVVYSTFQEFCKDWCDYDTNAEGRVGYFRNPRGHWDWYQIGGRWAGFFPLKPGAKRVVGGGGSFDNKPREGKGDVVRLSDIDFATAEAETFARAEQFWGKYQEWLARPETGVGFDSARSWAMDVGLVNVVQGPVDIKPADRFDLLGKSEEEGPAKVVVPWSTFISNPEDNRVTWNDVCLVPTREVFFRDYLHRFSVISTFAFLDDQGWHAPGEMGWFGADHSEEESKDAFKRQFVERFLLTSKPDDTLVMVDCHT